MHSYWSFDGFSSPATLLRRAEVLGLKLIAVTEHDNLDSWAELEQLGATSDVSILPGIEITTNWRSLTVGILGIGLDPRNGALREFLTLVAEEDLAFQRNWMAAAEEEGLGEIRSALASWVAWIFPDFPERKHRYVPEWILIRLLEECGLASSSSEAHAINDRLVKQAGHPELPAIDRVLDLVHQSGGLAVYEHPPANLARHDILDLMATGLDGIELFHGGVSSSLREELIVVAESEGWLVTAGSDHHGTRNGWGREGSLVDHPESLLASIRNALSATAYGETRL